MPLEVAKKLIFTYCQQGIVVEIMSMLEQGLEQAINLSEKRIKVMRMGIIRQIGKILVIGAMFMANILDGCMLTTILQ